MENPHRKEKKQYGWLVSFATLTWLAIGLMIWRVEPETVKNFVIPGSYLPMTLLVTIGLFWILAILLMSSATAFRWAVGIGLFLQLRVLGLGSWLNGLLILGILISREAYLFKMNRPRLDSEKETD